MFVMAFRFCLSRKRPSHGLGGNARDGLSPLPVKEKAVSWTWCALAGGFPRRPKKPPEVPGELSKPKHAILVNKCNTKVMVFGTRSNLYIFCSWPRVAPRRLQEASRLTFYPACRGKGLCRSLCNAFAMPFSLCLLR